MSGTGHRRAAEAIDAKLLSELTLTVSLLGAASVLPLAPVAPAARFVLTLSRPVAHVGRPLARRRRRAILLGLRRLLSMIVLRRRPPGTARRNVFQGAAYVLWPPLLGRLGDLLRHGCT